MTDTAAKPQRDRRIPVMMTGEEVAAIDAWRFENRIATRSAALRQLCQLALRVLQTEAHDG
jgi:hypothetical protein